ncbi:MAG: glycosyltransferase family 2 protein [Bacteroidales bacterium]|nr:glycosyltransferase family 2 protein [Candidatus Sodaliphilus aphodohippi]
MGRINCFIPFANPEQVKATIEGLKANELVNNIYLLANAEAQGTVEGCEVIHINNLTSTATIKAIAEKADADFTMVYTKYVGLKFAPYAIERFVKLAEDSMSGMLYADHYNVTDKGADKAPVIDYQFGSLRDDFDFGSVLFFCSYCFKKAAAAMKADYEFAGLYDLRLKLSQFADICHINEFLYSDVELDTRKSGEKIFDYVDPRNRGRQIEMEAACTEHLKEIGGYLAPVKADGTPNFKHIEFNQGEFPVEATVMIPVRNRIRTIRDAIDSVLRQKTNFKFNLMVVDNWSDDGTREAIAAYTDERLIHIIADYHDMGIGGYWNLAAHHEKAGKFIVQLDSDDMYKDENTLQTMVDAFYEQNVAMVVGTYMMTDIDCNPIPPGIIDHKEWTPENGRNNALRINGLGAPRAFYTPVLRQVMLPNTSYGEDYALGLNISRTYQIGRVYTPVYMCRRWDDNSDASLDVEKMNRNNLYKDRIRTWELQARVAMNKKK